MASEPAINIYRPDRPGVRKVLGDLEAEIMELLWARQRGDGTTVRTIFELLYQRRRLAYTTVMNTMARLARKHLLRAETSDQAYVYYPTCTRQEFISRFTGRLLEDLLVGFAGSGDFSAGGSVDPQTAQRVRQLLEEIARRRAAEEGP